MNERKGVRAINSGLPLSNSPELEEFGRKKRPVFYLKADIDIPDEVLCSLGKKRDREMDSLIPTISRECKKVFGKDPASVTPLRGVGTFHWLYNVQLPGEKSYVFRAGVTEVPYHEFHFTIDPWIMEKLKERGLPALEIVSVDLSRRLCSFDYAIMQKARGNPLNNFGDDNNLYKNLTSELGCIVAKIHSLPCTGFGLIDIKNLLKRKTAKGVFSSWKEYIALNLKGHIKTCLDIGAINPKEATRIEDVFEDTTPLLEDFVRCLLHGDLGAPNIFSDGRVISAVLDWEDCLIGDPVFDIALWGTFYINNSEDRLKAFIEGYETGRALPSDFELRYWLYYLRVALSKTVHRHRFRYPDPVGGPPASHRIQKSLSKVEKLL
jgi:aminoglycoside phosphotransferase (APT) family kinase protein